MNYNLWNVFEAINWWMLPRVYKILAFSFVLFFLSLEYHHGMGLWNAMWYPLNARILDISTGFQYIDITPEIAVKKV